MATSPTVLGATPAIDIITDRIWHAMTVEEVLTATNTDATTGLAKPEAAARLTRDGPNRMTPPPPRTIIRMIWDNFNSIISYILLASAIIAGIFEDWPELALILFVVVVNVALGVIQEGRAEQATRAINAMVSSTALVTRNSKRLQVSAADLVVGDIVNIAAGDRIPADLRFIDVADLQIIESVLTGESAPISKSTTRVSSRAGLGDQSCMGFSGTLAVTGQGTAVVVAVGDNAAIGKINRMMQETTTVRTPLLIQIDNFGRSLSVMCIALAVAVFFIAWAGRDYDVRDALETAVSVAVALIPEGLGVVVTIALSAGVQAMAKHNVIVRQLPAVETLGSVTDICSDKTGTLTRNEMTAVTVHAPGGHVLRVTGVGYHPDGDVKSAELDANPSLRIALQYLMLPAVLCNDATLMPASSHDAIRLLATESVSLPLPGGSTSANTASSYSTAATTAGPVEDAAAGAGAGGAAVDVHAVSVSVSPGLIAPDAASASASGPQKRTRSSSHRVMQPVLPVTWSWTGDPTEAALVALGMKAGLNLRTLQVLHRAAPRIDTVPFSSDIRFMATLHDITVPESLLVADGNGATTSSTALVTKRVAFLKGSPDVLLPRCARQAVAMNPWRGEPIDVEKWSQQSADLSHEGLRVLAMCHVELPSDFTVMNSDTFLEGEPLLTLHCLVGIIDPPRSDATAAIAVCHSAGIEVRMITGDHAETARTISGWMGIPNEVVLTGADVHGMDDVALREAVLECRVFARATPEHKLRIVRALQYQKHTCAMTGDGVNDAPALKAANVGVAMGVTGTEVAKEAAKLILVDDNFASIAAAVKYGRGCYSNIVKQLCFLLPTSVAQGFSIAVAIAIGIEQPLTAIQVLWVNMITAATLGLVIGLEEPEEGIMALQPRRPGKWLVGKRVIWRTLFVSALILAAVLGNSQWTLHMAGRTIEEAHTVALNTLVIVQSVYCLSCRFLTRSSVSVEGVISNPWLTAMMFLNAGLQALITYTPALHSIFDTASINGYDWLRILGLALAVFILVEVEKACGPKYLGPYVTPFVKRIKRAVNCCNPAPQPAPVQPQASPVAQDAAAVAVAPPVVFPRSGTAVTQSEPSVVSKAEAV